MGKWLVIEHADKLEFDKQKMYECLWAIEYCKDGTRKILENTISGYSRIRLTNPIMVALVAHSPYMMYDKWVAEKKIEILYNAVINFGIDEPTELDFNDDILPARSVIEYEIKRYVGCEKVTYAPDYEYYCVETDYSTGTKRYRANGVGAFDGILEQLDELNISFGEFMLNPNYGIIYVNESADGSDVFSKMLNDGIINKDAIETFI